MLGNAANPRLRGIAALIESPSSPARRAGKRLVGDLGSPDFLASERSILATYPAESTHSAGLRLPMKMKFEGMMEFLSVNLIADSPLRKSRGTPGVFRSIIFVGGTNA